MDNNNEEICKRQRYRQTVGCRKLFRYAVSFFGTIHTDRKYITEDDACGAVVFLEPSPSKTYLSLRCAYESWFSSFLLFFKKKHVYPPTDR